MLTIQASNRKPDMNLLPHQQRVVDEKAELDKKATDLSNFIGLNPIFNTLSPDEQERLKVQNDLMWSYSEVLGARIATFAATKTEVASQGGEQQAQGKTAPRVTPADVEACVASEHYFTAAEGVSGSHFVIHNPNNRGPLSGVQFCVLVLKNGHIVTGEALLQDLSKPDPVRAIASARRRAFDKAYDMVVYAERSKLAGS